MKLKALRVAQVGRFDDPVAVEGFSGKLNVLAGPNEMGKSTLFRALRLLLTAKHSARGGSVAALTPYGGGQPLIEADIETGDRLWRITKRFGKGPRAQLVDLGRDVVVSRGVEADEQVADLLGSGDGNLGALGLVWVGQKQALLTPRPDVDPGTNKLKDRGERSALMSVIEAEVGAMTGGGVADEVAAKVEAELGEMVTMRGARKGSRYAAALALRDSLAAELADGRAALDEVAERQADLDELQASLSDAGRPDALNALEQRARVLGEELEAAERQTRVVRQAKDAVSIQLKEQEAARGVLVRIDADLLKLQQLGEAVVEDEQRLPELRFAAQNAQSAYETCRKEGEKLGAQERELMQLKNRQAIAGKYAELSAKLVEAQKLDSEIADGAERMKSDPVSAERVERLRQIENQRQVLEGRLCAESPVLRMSYDEGVSPSISFDGEVLGDGQEVTATDLIVLEIAGVGRLEVRPGGGASREGLNDELARLSDQSVEVLQVLGATDLEHARALLSEREVRDRAFADAMARLRGVAPDGLQSLRADVADLENQLGSAGGDGDEEFAANGEDYDLEERLEAVSTALVAARDVYRVRLDARDQTSKVLAEAEAEARARSNQRDELARMLGDDGELDGLREAARRRVEAADQQANEALRTLAALEETAPDRAAIDELRGRAEAARTQLRRADQDARAMRERMVELSTQIDMAGASGVGRRVSECEGELARAERDVQRLEADIAALKLLQEALQRARSEARHRLMAPLQERLLPYLSAVFEDAEVAFQEGFAPEGLIRNGADAEAIERLSDGTQEQLAILVRLAYARLLSKGRNGVPLVLDDPLAYSDGERITQMFGALQSACEHHQVVVLTCREDAFSKLGGTWLEAQRWPQVTDLG
ncbi:MAG: AAA family ATPase [Alphaproteobacteria bacterium]|nr:AAA family ATPase [Alphaproteobacteria bacterium]